jgi:hypothetical protein
VNRRGKAEKGDNQLMKEGNESKERETRKATKTKTLALACIV